MSQRVLIAPLHWGLGHATRCIPIIEQQLAVGNTVLIAAEGGPRQILESRFSDLEYIAIPFMEITYPEDGYMVRHFAKRGFSLLRSIAAEHRSISRMVDKHKIDLVISDSRFGLWTRKAYCIFITHQVQIFSPVLSGVVNWLNRWAMKAYDEVWIPDYEEAPGLAGLLSHPPRLPRNAKYIGPLSRFKKPATSTEKEWDAVVIVSGPEPQRSLFEADMARRYIESDQKALIIRGRPQEKGKQDIGNLQLVSHLDDDLFAKALCASKKIISRSGYSTIMDLHTLGLEAEWHPTPGQTEQVYLAQLQSSDQSSTKASK